jgi:hypothetical protein
MRFAMTIAIAMVLAACGRSSPPQTTAGTKTTLDVAGVQEITNPSNEQIREAISSLVHGPDTDDFAVLSRSDSMYMQIAGDKSIGFVMEYQDGGVENHFVSERRDFSLDEVVRALCEYRDGKIDWNDYGKWTKS